MYSDRERRESEGAYIAAAVAVVAIGYGAFLLVSWRDGTGESVVKAAPPHVGTAFSVAPLGRIVEVQPRPVGLDIATLKAIWRRSDSRSLQRAFADLRRETLAFHRCSMQMTAVDRAVAHCDAVESRATVHWTLDFQRAGNSWAIQRVSNR
jgi:hypothetical protein